MKIPFHRSLIYQLIAILFDYQICLDYFLIGPKLVPIKTVSWNGSSGKKTRFIM